MEKEKSEILKDVRVILDEQRDNSALISDVDQISVETDDIIWSYITQAVDEVHLAAQSWLVADVAVKQAITLTAYKKGMKGTVPADFLRMLKLNAADLNTPAFDAINEDSDEYQMQSSKWAGVRGNADRPVVAIVPADEGGDTVCGLSIEVYGTQKTTADLTYIKRAEVTDDDTVDIAKQCYRSVLYALAKHYLMTLGDAEKATLFGVTSGGLVGASQPVTDVANQTDEQ